MRHLICLFFLSLFIINSNAQVIGHAKDAQGTAIKGATISLLAAKDSAVVKLALSKEDGAYNFSTIKEGKYLIKASFVEYEHFPQLLTLLQVTKIPSCPI